MLLIVFRHFCRENTNAHPQHKWLRDLKSTLETEVLCGKVNLSNSWPIWDAKKKCGKNTSELELHLHLTNSLEPSQQWITFQISLFYGKNFSTEWLIVTMNVCVFLCASAEEHISQMSNSFVSVCVHVCDGTNSIASNELHVSPLNKSKSITELFEKFCDNRKRLFPAAQFC